MTANSISRRTVLKSSACTLLATVGVPSIVPAVALGRDDGVAASERITMGLIGCGSHGRGWNLDLMFANPQQQVVAVCDVDQNHLNAAQKKVNNFYSAKSGDNYRGCDAYGDFRDLVNRRDIDAVDIVTPDHWHTPMAVFAMKAGKDVICEKPTLTIAEGKLLCETQCATKRVFQTASENRSIECYQRVANLARFGHLGEVRHIKVLLPPGNIEARNPNKDGIDPYFEVTEVPPTLNYDLWLGPTPHMPYIPARLHYNWRWNFATSGGVLPDWGSHLINIAQWANNSDDTGPVEVCGTGDFPPRDAVWNTAPTFNINYTYANGVTMNVWSEVPGIKIEGMKGWVLCRGWRGPLTASDEKLLTIPFERENQLGRQESTVPTQGGTGGEHIDFARCVRNREVCYYSVTSGHRTHTIAHLGNISMLLGGAKLTWDPVNERFTGNRAGEANAHECYQRPQREGWTFADIDSWVNVG